MTAFLAHLTTQQRSDKDVRARIKTLTRDASSLTEHSSSLSQKITFLLDATLGMINIQQNSIIKIFSVAAVVFLPPTLIASIYGMNYDHMPELDWRFGYPFALGLMLAVGVGFLVYPVIASLGQLLDEGRIQGDDFVASLAILLHGLDVGVIEVVQRLMGGQLGGSLN